MRRTLLGQQPPKDAHWQVGIAKNYYIHDGYTIRPKNAQFDDSLWTDECQREVYWFARDLFDQKGYSSVLDVGCGSGFKLVTNFYPFRTCGLEVDATYRHCIRAWPNREWGIVDDWVPSFEPDLMISADVIEHVLEPTSFLQHLLSLKPKTLVISTPERNLLMSGTHNGPPHNQAHVREWSFAEFNRLMADFFHIEEHFCLGPTQVLVGTP